MRAVAVSSLLLLLPVLSGCATAGGPAEQTGPEHNVLTEEDLAPHQNLSLHDAIERLRPEWLFRGRSTPNPLFTDPESPLYDPENVPTDRARVHIDTQPREFGELELIETSDVERVVFMSGPDATTLYGVGYPNGLIDVTTKR